MKRGLSIIIAAAMVFSSSVPAFAADNVQNEEITEEIVKIEEEDAKPADIDEYIIPEVNDEAGIVKVLVDDETGHYGLLFDCEYSYNTGEFAQLKNIITLDNSVPISGDVVVPETVMYNNKDITVVSIGQSAFEGSTISSVVLPSTVHEIQKNAFMNCPDLERVYINSIFDPERVNSDGVHIDAIDDVKNTGQHLPSSIGEYAFSGCTSLHSVYISGFATLGNNLFDGCTALTDVELAMDEVHKISSYKLSSYYQTIACGKYLFKGCESLVSFDIGNAVASMGEGAFDNCTSLETVNIGKALTTTLGYKYFNNCVSLREFTANEGGTFSTYDGMLCKITSVKIIDKDGNVETQKLPTRLCLYPMGKEGSDFTLPPYCTTVDAGAFYQNLYIKNFTVEAAGNYKKVGTELEWYQPAVSIGASAFYDAKSLESFNAVTIVNLGVGAFSNCAKLNAVSLADESKIENKCFEYCTDLKHIELKNIYKVGDYSFVGSGVEDFSYTKTMDIPIYLGAHVFEGSEVLKSISIHNVNSIGDYSFNNCKALTDIDLYNVLKIGNFVFSGCTALESVDLSNAFIEGGIGDLDNIGKNMFAECSNLKSVVYSPRQYRIPDNTFLNCARLESVTNVSPENLQYIGAKSFMGCTSLKEMPTSRFLTRIGTSAFSGCTSLEKAEFTRSGFIIGAQAFKDCDSLVIYAPEGSNAAKYAVENDIELIKTVDDIEDEEFLIIEPNDENEYTVSCYRGGFSSLTFPNELKINRDGTEITVNKIEKGFINYPLAKECSMKGYLTKVDFNCIAVIGESAFENCTPLASVKFGKSIEEIGKKAFKGCSNLSKIKFSDESGDKSINIGDEAFMNCRSVTEVILPLMTKNIGASAFSGCTDLEYIRFTPYTQNLGQYAFKNCTSLTSVTLQRYMFVDDYAFAGCSNIKRIIIHKDSNAAPSANAFCDCNTEDTYIVCAAGTKGEQYAASAGFQTEIVEFAENEQGYAIIKGTIEFPEEVNVSLNGVGLKTGDHIVGGDELLMTLADGLDNEYSYAILVNGSLIDETKHYVVRENENVYVTVKMTEKHSITIPPGVSVERNGISLTGSDRVIEGDVLKITANTDPYIYVTNLKVNNKTFTSGKEYTVKANEDVEITATVTYLGRLTFSGPVTVLLQSKPVDEAGMPYPVKSGNYVRFSVNELPEGQKGKVYLNGVEKSAAGFQYTIKKISDNTVEDINITAYVYEQSDAQTVLRAITGSITLTPEEAVKYDIDRDGSPDLKDAITIIKMFE